MIILLFFFCKLAEKNKFALSLEQNNKNFYSSTIMEGKNVHGYLKQLAEEMNGNYTEYSDDTIILTIPLEDGRFQSVRGLIQEKQEAGMFLILSSTICRLHEYPDVDFRKMLEHNYDLGYSKITITDEDYLELAVYMKYDLVTAEELRYMVREIAVTADKLELEITGKDHH